jgi:hypothetical protein
MTLTGAAYGVYPRNVVLPDVVCALNRAGVKNEDICMVLSPVHPVATIVRDARIVNAEQQESVVSASLIGWLSEFGAVVIPTVGFFIRSQEFFHALVIEQEFGALCGQSRTLASLGFCEDEARKLGHQLDDSGVLIYVSCQQAATAEWVTELLRSAGASEAATLKRNQAEKVPYSLRGPKEQDRIPRATPISYTLPEGPSLALAAAQEHDAS